MGTQLSNLCLQRRKTTEKGAREQSLGTLPCRDTLRTHWTHPQIPILSTYRGRLRFWETAYLPRDCRCLWSHTNGVKSKTDSKNAVFVSCVRSLPESISPLSGTYIISWDKYVIEPFSSTLSQMLQCRGSAHHPSQSSGLKTQVEVHGDTLCVPQGEWGMDECSFHPLGSRTDMEIATHIESTQTIHSECKALF